MLVLVLFGFSCKTHEQLLIQKPAVELVGTYWKLVELNAQPLNNDKVDEIFVQLNADHTFKGFAGCNSFWGLFKTKDPQIKFSNTNRTKKMCDRYTTENELIKAMESCEAYIINGARLHLILMNGTTLCIFESTSIKEKK